MFALLAPPLETEAVVVGVDADEAATGNRIARAVDYLHLHAIPARPHVVAGDAPPVDVLLELSERWRARMVVMGAHVVSELGAWLFESVTAGMLKGARCPLFLYL
jgi:nucleotide-binding universal stress UspA family protein